MKLNLGSGDAVMDGCTNVDRVAYPGVAVVMDVERHSWPFSWRDVTEIVACQLFEHLDDPVEFMRRCHHALVEGGTLLITTPHYRSRNTFTDPTHRRHCTEQTWDYWINGTTLHARHNQAMGGITFRSGHITTVDCGPGGPDLRAVLVK